VKVKKSSSLGGVCASIAIIFILALIISSSIDFILMNIVEKSTFNFQEISTPKKSVIIVNITSLVNNCDPSEILFSGFQGNITQLYTTTMNFSCSALWICRDCDLTGFNQEVCFKFKRYSSLISYKIEIPSVVDTEFYTITGKFSSVENELFYEKQTNIYVSFFNVVYTKLVGEFASSIVHLIDYFTNIENSVYYGLMGYITGVDQGSTKITKRNIQIDVGFSVCVVSTLSPLLYQIEETNKQSLLNFIAQIASLSATIIGVFGMVFRCAEKHSNKMKNIIPSIFKSTPTNSQEENLKKAVKKTVKIDNIDNNSKEVKVEVKDNVDVFKLFDELFKDEDEKILRQFSDE
jgi:hypothetical protein